MPVNVQIKNYNYQVIIPNSALLSEALIQAGLPLPCGGRGLCGKCKVKVIGKVSEPTMEELKILKVEELCQGIRLACQCRVLEDVIIENVYNFNNNINFQQMLPVTEGGQYYLAIDLGTTNIKLVLYNMQRCQVARVTTANQQLIHGADILTRLSYAQLSEDNWLGLQHLVVKSINSAIAVMTKELQLPLKDIRKVAIAGNTIMTVFLLGLFNMSPWGVNDIKSIALKPYSGKEFGLVFEEDVEVYVLPPLAKYVGGDLLAGILGTNLRLLDNVMLIDIGTNVEICLSHGAKYYICSTAAGPAFEGGNISQGMPAVDGAINKAYYQGLELKYKVIGGVKPQGICGSGFFTLISNARKQKFINASGRVLQPTALAFTDTIKVTQQDIRQFQLAKAAVRTGIDLLMQQICLAPQDISKVIISGSFGSSLAISDLVTLGLLTPQLADLTESIENSCLCGLEEFLFALSSAEEINKIIDCAYHVDLAALSEFEEVFINNLSF